MDGRSKTLDNGLGEKLSKTRREQRGKKKRIKAPVQFSQTVLEAGALVAGEIPREMRLSPPSKDLSGG